ncbi:MAG: POT family MFS transporter [Planctomycetia bacterium]|nr:POT family MFS transporter [Planctomycetia bacterium]
MKEDAATTGPYRTVPEDTAGMPGGVPYIIGNEAAERFSYYGMRSILVVYMTEWLVDGTGALDVMNKEQATAWYSLFLSSVYFFPMLGAIVADGVLGKYRTILYVSLLYCLGHLVLAIGGTEPGNGMGLTPRWALAVGLTMIAVGSGGIKPCVSANVGDQFGPRNQHLLEKVYAWFYFSINFGSMFSTILIPELLNRYGPHVAFALPGVLMGLATVIFWMGRHKFVHRPPAGLDFVREAFTPEGMRALAKPVIVTLFVAMFWSLYDQSSSTWILQARDMNRVALGREWLPAQIHTVNPVLILLFIPLFSYGIYPAINRVFPLTAVRKISIGLFLTALSFVVSAYIEHMIAGGLRPHIAWQILAYIVLASAEVMVSITGLEFSYTVAPRSMKSIVMAIWLLSLSLGNALTAVVNVVIQNEDGTSKLPGPSYYWFFAAMMFVTAVGFVLVSSRFREPAADESQAAV